MGNTKPDTNNRLIMQHPPHGSSFLRAVGGIACPRSHALRANRGDYSPNITLNSTRLHFSRDIMPPHTLFLRKGEAGKNIEETERLVNKIFERKMH